MSSSNLSNPLIRSWWENAHDNIEVNSIQRGFNIFGEWRIFAQEIPSESCYNYLEMLGVTVNSFAEILLTDSEMTGYLDFQMMLWEEENDKR